MSRRHILSEHYIQPGKWELKYMGGEDYVYLAPTGRSFIDTNVYFDFNTVIPYGFIMSDEFRAEKLKLSSLLTERGREIRISFTRPAGAAEWIRIEHNACIGFLYPIK